MYNEYKIARNKSWEVLIDVGIFELPVNLSIIAKHYNIQILSYNDSQIEYSDIEDGFSVKINGRYIIYYNSKKPVARIRFTIAHELGHCLLNHIRDNEITFRRNSETDSNIDIKEIQANVFARDILMPAAVLHRLNIASASDIAKICNVSMTSAEIRYKRLVELRKRGMFNSHPLERKVHNQFSEYIKKVSDTGNIWYLKWEILSKNSPQ